MAGDGRRWSCRAARRGSGGAGCRHFHVHYHIPRQVWSFSPPRPRLQPRFLLLPYLLILPVLFLAVLAFLVCFGWLTLVYLASSLWSRSMGLAGDDSEFAGEDEREERPVKLVTEHAGHSGLSQVCAEGKEIREREVEDGISEECRYISSMASTGICINDDVRANDEKIVEEVMMFEPSKAFVGSTKKHRPLMDNPIDCFLEELNNREFSISLNNTTKLLNVLSIGEVFDPNTMEVPVLSLTEISKFIDKHDTAELVNSAAGTDFAMPEVSSSDDSIPHGLGDECTKEIKQEQSLAELSVDTVPEKLPEDVTDEWQETQALVIEHNNKQPPTKNTESRLLVFQMNLMILYVKCLVCYSILHVKIYLKMQQLQTLRSIKQTATEILNFDKTLFRTSEWSHQLLYLLFVILPTTIGE